MPQRACTGGLTYTAGGRLIAAWRDRRCCGGAFGDRFDMWARAIGSGSSPAVRLTAEPQEPTTSHRGGGTIPSEFIGLAADGDTLMAAWDQVAGDYTDNVFR